jgi:hypothetical protein
MPRFYAPTRRPRPLPASWFRRGARKHGPSGAGWAFAATRGGSIFVVADQTSELRSLAH